MSQGNQGDNTQQFIEITSDSASSDVFAEWTYEARAAAKPLASPLAVEDGTEAASVEESVGTPGSSQGANPVVGAEAAARQEYPDEWRRAAGEVAIETYIPEEEYAADGTANVFSNYRGNYYSQFWQFYPLKAVGKLYFRTSTGGNATCSASVIGPNLIVTAAHCLYNTVTNRWNSNFVFVPADRNGAAPYGTFPFSNGRVPTAWATASGTVRRYDVALLTLRTNSAGRSVSYYTGWLGTIWDASSIQHLHAVGYPVNIDSGRYSYICAAESFSAGTDILGMGCNMEHGSSGGPWIRKLYLYAAPAGTNQVNSVVSGGTPGTPTFYGPRFSSTNFRTLCGGGWC
jgi:V8-like Glu-specific endopeptidase